MTELPVLDRIPFFDERSREHPVRGVIQPTARYKRIWTARFDALDQGSEGACVGFACATELAAAPIRWVVDNSVGTRIYKAAEMVDASEGRNYPSGATVLAGMKAGTQLKYFDKYVWGFSLDDLIDGVIRKGPALIGSNWYTGMDNPKNGMLDASGTIRGGHCFMVNGYWPAHPDFGDVLVMTNTWGPKWGIRGRAYISLPGMQKLLSEQGEVVFPHDMAQMPVGTVL